MKKYLAVAIALLSLAATAGVLWLATSSDPSSTGTTPIRPHQAGTTSSTPEPAVTEGSLFASVAGIVTRETTNEPIAKASIQLWQGRNHVATVLSRPQGRYTFNRIPPGSYDIKGWQHDGDQLQYLDSVTLEARQVLEKPLVFPGGKIISGRITTSDRRVLSQATLHLDYFRNEHVYRESRDCKLDKDGSFTVFLEATGVIAYLTASAQDYAATRPPIAIYLTTRDPVDLLLHLTRGGHLKGVVVNERKQSIPGAVVHFQRFIDGGKLQGYPATCDDAGRFEAWNIPEGTFTPTVEAKGYIREPLPIKASVILGQKSPELILTVRRGWRISGRVVDDKDKPVSDARIEVREGMLPYQTKSDAAGSFSINGIAPDSSEIRFPGIDLLTCRVPGFASITQKNLEPGTSVTLKLAQPGELEVTLTLSDRETPDDFTWYVIPAITHPGNPIDSSAQPTTIYERKGKTGKIPNLPPGLYEVTVAAKDRDAAVYPGIVVRSREPALVHATLVPGKSDHVVNTKRTSVRVFAANPAEYMKRLKASVKDLPPEEREETIKKTLNFLRQMRDTLPLDSNERRVLDQALSGDSEELQQPPVDDGKEKK